MAQNKKSVILYCDIIHTIEQLDDVDAGLLFKHYLRYINDQNPEPPNKLIQIVFEPIKQNLKRDLKIWENKCLKNKDNAKKRWDANAYNRKKTNANNADNGNVKDIVKDTVKVNENEIEIIIDSLNEILNTKYKKSEKTKKLINARLNEGFSVDDFKSVIYFKKNQWGQDIKMREYLRPETLFSNKFESYLQSSKINRQPPLKMNF